MCFHVNIALHLLNSVLVIIVFCAHFMHILENITFLYLLFAMVTFVFFCSDFIILTLVFKLLRTACTTLIINKTLTFYVLILGVDPYTTGDISPIFTLWGTFRSMSPNVSGLESRSNML